MIRRASSNVTQSRTGACVLIIAGLAWTACCADEIAQIEDFIERSKAAVPQRIAELEKRIGDWKIEARKNGPLRYSNLKAPIDGTREEIKSLRGGMIVYATIPLPLEPGKIGTPPEETAEFVAMRARDEALANLREVLSITGSENFREIRYRRIPVVLRGGATDRIVQIVPDKNAGGGMWLKMKTVDLDGRPKIVEVPASAFPLPDLIEVVEPTTLPDGRELPTIRPFDFEKLHPYVMKSGKWKPLKKKE